MVKVKLVNKSNYPAPEYATPGSSGVDLYADIDHDMVVRNGEISLVNTGICIKLPQGYEAQVRARSGLSLKHGIFLVNGIGTIDSDYTGEIKVILSTAKKEPFTVKPGMKIAQLIITRYETVEFEEVDSLEPTERGDGGFGHTGV